MLVVCLLCDGTVPPTGPHTSARARQDLFLTRANAAFLPAEMVEKRKRDGKEKRQCQRLRRKEREEAEKNDDALIQASIDENASRASGADAQEAAEERLSPASAPSGQQIEGTSPSDRRYAAGLAMLRGSERFVKDPAAALRLFDGAARQGNVSAQHMSAIFYLHGIATDANRERAKELFEMAAQQCHPPSMYELGSLLLANEEEQARMNLCRCKNGSEQDRGQHSFEICPSAGPRVITTRIGGYRREASCPRASGPPTSSVTALSVQAHRVQKKGKLCILCLAMG